MTEMKYAPSAAANKTIRRPRLGFLGVGWIGRNRMEAMLAGGKVDAVAIADPAPDMAEAAQVLAPEARLVADLDDLLTLDLDGLVIATPSGLHAEQAIRALEAGLAVFCQKPLGRSAAEVEAVLEAARRADRLLGIDLSYRFTAAMRTVKAMVESGQLGGIHAVDLTFHNAYGPDKPWFYDPRLSGGGCVMDLGVHLVDLALWTLGYPEVVEVAGTLRARGRRCEPGTVEDYAVGTIELDSGAVVRLACSWNLQAGRDAEISATFYGLHGAVAFRNEQGSFYDFVAERYEGSRTEVLVSPPDGWGGRAAADWAAGLALNVRFCRGIERHLHVARVLDRLYGR